MVRLSVLGLGAYAAVCMSASPASANDINLPAQINLRCYAPRFVTRQAFRQVTPALAALDALAPLDEPGTGGSPPPRISNVALDYRINPGNSTVNGETLQIDQIDNQIYARVLKLAWHRPADASVPAAHYVLDLRTNGIVVSFDNGESDVRKVESTEFRLRCTRPLRENS
jgi:hypothetical protein